MEGLTTRNNEGAAALEIPYRCGRCGEEICQLANCVNGEPIEKLFGDGKALPFHPCAIGDKLYEPRPDRGIITEYRVISITYSGNGWHIGWLLNSGIYSNLDGIPADKIGKTVFLTLQEAEGALERMVNGK